MKKFSFRKLLSLIFFSSLIMVGASMAQPTKSAALLLNIDGAIGPAAATFFKNGLAQAIKQNDKIIILQLDTPGGLDKSMREIIASIINSPIPVVTYVAPSGAHAASAGTYILYASHIAAMAPGTNVGAATPVSIGVNSNTEKKSSTMEKKTLQDASAYMRSLAELRNRNITWAEQAVTGSVSISATQALQQHVIDVIAKDVPDLLQQINGRTVNVQGKTQTLVTTNLTLTTYAADWRTKLLTIITDPSVAYILLMIGIWGLFFEFANPGFVLPGVVGAISLLMALYAFQLLPINYVGLSLIFLGVIFLVAEAFVASFGALGFGGIIALVIGSIFLLDNSLPGFQIAWQLILGVTLTTALFFLLIINIALKSRFKPVVSGKEELINKTGIVKIDDRNNVRVLVLGEMWQAHSDKILKEGQLVKIKAVNGLTLLVEPIHSELSQEKK